MGGYIDEINRNVLIIKYFSNNIFKGNVVDSYTYEINRNVLIIKLSCHIMT